MVLREQPKDLGLDGRPPALGDGNYPGWRKSEEFAVMQPDVGGSSGAFLAERYQAINLFMLFEP